MKEVKNGILSLGFVCVTTLVSLTAAAQSVDDLKLATNFLSAKERAWQQHATPSDVEKIFGFVSDSVQYNHVLSPAKTFSFTGKDDWRSGMLSHLGETRNVKLKILKSISRQNVVIVEFTLYRELKDGTAWKDSNSTTVSVMEFDEKGKIKKITDYL
jgi:hypothetical protein